MNKFLALLILLIFLGCSLNYDYSDYIQPVKNEEKITNDNYPKEEKPANLEPVLEKELILIDPSIIDSLNLVLKEKEFVIDSLKTALEISNSRVAVNKNFVIPDSIEFAGRIFDLTSERIYEKFRIIYNEELRSAHRYIPRSGKYFAYFDSIFVENSIPLDVKYLAIAESRLSSFAGSRVGALGIWQFMPKTAKGFGMKIDSFIDERKNIFKATPAAASYLTNAHNILSRKGADDWLLAMAAYNAGVGSISKVIRQQESTDFFEIMLRVDETNKYVWRAAAIKIIMENQKKIFGKKFELQESILSKNKLVKAKLKGHYKIDDWVKAQGTNLGDVLELNPWIKIYKKKREKYSAINNVVLPPGNYSILIPKNSKKNLKNLAIIEKQFLDTNAGFFTQHIVKRGDNLYDIAKRYKTTVAKIKQINGLRSNVIYPKQKLKLYGTASKGKYHIVKKGETVGGIAHKLGISTKKLIAMNKLKNSNGIVIIRPGQKLYY